MKQKYKILLKDSAVFALGSLSSKIILFLLVPLYTNYLTTGEYGSSDLVLNLSSLLVIVATMEMDHAVLRFSMDETEKKEDVFVTSAVICFGFLIIFLSISPLLSLYQVISRVKRYLIAQVFLDSFAQIEMSYLKGIGRNRAFSSVGVLRTLIFAVANVFLLRIKNLGIGGFLLANNIAAGTAAILPFVYILKYGRIFEGRFSRILARRILFFSFPIAVGAILWWIMQYADRYIIERNLGENALGIYGLSAKMSALINIVVGIFYQSWGLSTIREYKNDEKGDFFTNIRDVYSAGLFGTGIVFIIVCKPFMAFYVGDGFGDSIHYTPILLCATVFYGLSLYYSVFYESHKITWKSLFPVVICSVTDIFFCILLTPGFGLMGAGISKLFSNFLYLIIIMIDTGKYVSFDRDYFHFFLQSILLVALMLAVTFEKYILFFALLSLTVYIYSNRKIILLAMNKVKELNRFF